MGAHVILLRPTCVQRNLITNVYHVYIFTQDDIEQKGSFTVDFKELAADQSKCNVSGIDDSRYYCLYIGFC